MDNYPKKAYLIGWDGENECKKEYEVDFYTLNSYSGRAQRIISENIEKWQEAIPALCKHLIPNLAMMVLEYNWENKFEIRDGYNLTVDCSAVKITADWINHYSNGLYPPSLRSPTIHDENFSAFVHSCIENLSPEEKEREKEWYASLFANANISTRVTTVAWNMLMSEPYVYTIDNVRNLAGNLHEISSVHARFASGPLWAFG